MIDAKDLMINNWIEIDNGEKLKYFYQITAHDMEEIDGYGEDCYPIPLTTEILERCGFEWETDKKAHLELQLPDDGLDRKRLAFYYNNGAYEMLQIYQFDYFGGQINIKPPIYVHQLQNFYYALSGEELEVKL
jgi:hypothetical protein